MVAEFGGAEREAAVGGGGGHVRVGRGEGGLELGGQGAVAGLVMGEDSWGWEEPVRVVRVGADAQGHLVNDGAPLWVRQAVAVLNQRGRGGQHGLGRVVRGRQGSGGLVGQERVRGQALGVCGGGGGSVCGAAVRQVGKSVSVDSGGDVGVRSQRPVVAVPIFVAVVWHVELHLRQRTPAGQHVRQHGRDTSTVWKPSPSSLGPQREER